MNSLLMTKSLNEINKIILGDKKFEYLTSKGKYFPESIYYYLPSVEGVVLEAEVLGIEEATTSEMWENTSKYSGYTKESFFNFYGKRRKAYAYALGKITIYDPPFLLSELKVPYSWNKETTLHI